MHSDPKSIQISPATNGKMTKILNDNGDEMTCTETVASEKDLQIYYYVLSNTLKNYKRFKENEHLFRNTDCCDLCYQLYSLKDPMYQLKTDNISLCEACYEKNEHKDNYERKNNSINEHTGLRW